MTPGAHRRRQLPDRGRRPDALHAGNAYDHLYEAECGDAVRSLLLFGHVADARQMVGPLLDFNRQATRFHVAGHKLQLLAHYYWVTRDKDYLARPAKWEPVVDVHPRQPQDRQRPAAEGQLRRRHEHAGVLAELERRVLARPAGHGRRARRPRRGGERRPSCARRPRRSARRSSTRWPRACAAKEKFVPVALFGDEAAARPAHRDPPGQLLRPHHPLRARVRRVRPRRRARGAGSSTTCAPTAPPRLALACGAGTDRIRGPLGRAKLQGRRPGQSAGRTDAGTAMGEEPTRGVKRRPAKLTIDSAAISASIWRASAVLPCW